MKKTKLTTGITKNALIEWQRLHTGVYARVAKRTKTDPSYVSRVARGERQSTVISEALVREITRIQKLWPGQES